MAGSTHKMDDLGEIHLIKPIKKVEKAGSSHIYICTLHNIYIYYEINAKYKYKHINYIYIPALGSTFWDSLRCWSPASCPSCLPFLAPAPSVGWPGAPARRPAPRPFGPHCPSPPPSWTPAPASCQPPDKGHPYGIFIDAMKCLSSGHFSLLTTCFFVPSAPLRERLRIVQLGRLHQGRHAMPVPDVTIGLRAGGTPLKSRVLALKTSLSVPNLKTGPFQLSLRSTKALSTLK